MRTNNRQFAILATLLLLAATAPALAGDAIDGTIKQYDVAAQLFGSRVQSIGKDLLLWLFGLQLIVNAIKWALKSAEIGELAGAMVWSLLSVGFFFLLIDHPETYLKPILDGFEFVGRQGSGLGELTPSTIFQQGIDLQDVMVQYFNDGTGADKGFFAALKNFGPSLLLTVACLIILISFAVLAWQMALAMISGYFWLALTPVLLGFGGIHFTRDMALSALKGGVAVGMKIATVYLVAGVAGTLAPLWGVSMKDVTLSNWDPIWHVVFASGLLAYLSFQLPKLASDLLNGQSSLSAGDAATNMAMGAAAVAAGATGVGALAMGGLQAAGSAALGAGQAAGAAGSGLAKALGAGFQPGTISNAATAGAGRAMEGAAVAPPSTPSSASAMPIAPGVAGMDVPPDFRAVAPPTGTTTGDASGASISGGNSADPSASGAGRPRLHERIREAGHQIPQDAATVGMNASISSHIGD